MTDSRALYIICMENNIVKMRQALAGGFNPNQRLYEDGFKALHIVASKGYQEMASLLLQQPDIELNPRQDSGETPLHWAAYFGEQEVVALLLQQPGIELNPKTQDTGETPLHFAALPWDRLTPSARGPAGPAVLRRLLACPGTDPNVKNQAGKTPIMELLAMPGNCLGNALGSNLVGHLRAFVEFDRVDLDDQDGRSLEDLAR